MNKKCVRYGAHIEQIMCSEVEQKMCSVENV